MSVRFGAFMTILGPFLRKPARRGTIWLSSSLALWADQMLFLFDIDDTLLDDRASVRLAATFLHGSVDSAMSTAPRKTPPLSRRPSWRSTFGKL